VRVALDQLLEPRLEERDLALGEPRDLRGVDVDAAHLVAEVRQARARDQAHVPRSHHRDPNHAPP
jgi:hypothetical protein